MNGCGLKECLQDRIRYSNHTDSVRPLGEQKLVAHRIKTRALQHEICYTSKATTLAKITHVQIFHSP